MELSLQDVFEGEKQVQECQACWSRSAARNRSLLCQENRTKIQGEIFVIQTVSKPFHRYIRDMGHRYYSQAALNFSDIIVGGSGL